MSYNNGALQGQLLLRSNTAAGPVNRLREFALTTARLTPTALVYADSKGRVAGSVPLELVQFVDHEVDNIHPGCNVKHLGSCFRIQTTEEEVEAVAGSPAAAEEWCTEILRACEDLQRTLRGDTQPQQQQTKTKSQRRESKVSFEDEVKQDLEERDPLLASAKKAANLIAAKVSKKAMTSPSQSPKPPPPPQSAVSSQASEMIERVAKMDMSSSSLTKQKGQESAPSEDIDPIVQLKKRLLTTRWHCATALTRAEATIQNLHLIIHNQKNEMSESYLLLKKCESELEKTFTERDILLEHSASLEVQIRTMIEEQAIREFHSQQTIQSAADAPLNLEPAASIKSTLASDGPPINKQKDTRNASEFIDHGVVDEQEILLLKDKLRDTETEMLRLRNELNVSKDTVNTMIIESANRDREDMMRVFALNQEIRVPVYFQVSFYSFLRISSCQSKLS